MSDQPPPVAPQPSGQPRSIPNTPQYYPGSPGQVPPNDPRAQHPAPPPAPRMHVGAIIAIIVGGLLVLGLTFASGAAVGWWLGAHHGTGWSQNGPGYPRGPDAPERHQQQLPGQPDEGDQPDS